MTNSMWVTLLYFFARHCSLINHVSSHDQQNVSDTAYLFARQSHQSCFIPWPTGCEWHCFSSLPGNLINHGSSHDQQEVSGTALFLCQAVSSIMFHLMTNRKWVALLYFFARWSHQSCLIQWPTGSEWTGLFLCHAVSSIMFHPMTNRKWVTLVYFFPWQCWLQSCLISWPTASK